MSQALDKLDKKNCLSYYVTVGCLIRSSVREWAYPLHRVREGFHAIKSSIPIRQVKEHTRGAGSADTLYGLEK